MDRIRIIAALVLSTIVFAAWPIVVRQFFPDQPREITEQAAPDSTGPEHAGMQAGVSPSESPKAVSKSPQATDPRATASTPSPAITQVPPREIVVETPFYRATLSNRGAVATSWVLKKVTTGGRLREIHAADGSPDLEIIPQTAVEALGAPFRLHTPWSPAVGEQLNQVNFQIEGPGAGAQKVELGPDQKQQITFTYSSPAASARKTFVFYGDRMVFDVTADVTSGGTEQPASVVIGPRIGDQSDKQTGGSYSTPPQVVAYNIHDKREGIVGSHITPSFAKITRVDEEGRQVQIEKPLAGDVDSIKIVGADGHTFLGFARVIERQVNGQLLTLDAIPSGTAVGTNVAQGTDTLRHGYRWAGIVDHYFGMVAVPPQPASEIVLTNVQFKNGDHIDDYPSVAVPVDAKTPMRVFVGPKDRELLASASLREELGENLEPLIDYGIFAVMVRPLLPVIGAALDGFAKLFSNNYGWAIILVTIVINLALSPLKWYSSKKMKKAAKHQPRMKELQDRMKKYKENPKKYERELLELQKEQMALMKEANPLGGCLPLLLQMPIFWAFFVYLTISLDMRQAPWLVWIHDLSKPDPYHILPIVMCVSMIASTMLTPQPASADPAMKMQRVMMTYLMPVMLTWFFFLSSPSGLVLYWMMSNLVGVAIQLVINKFTAEPPEAPVLPSTNAGGRKKDRSKGKKDSPSVVEA
ncbi:MAG TPA: YidC/Oxa1 family insertase periplasmic-domain containing protein [Blastocatellia bacterium]|nr:YidC/Oxa1 family insertase periplasmic-domain containing protein [Blastocatellia bacterium]